MAYIGRNGELVEKAPPFGLHAILAFFHAVFNFIVFFFKTLLNPGAADEYASKNRRNSGGGGGGSGGGGYGRQSSRGPRVTGLSDLRDASGAAACGAGG